jgi:hypothetical protein
VKLRKLLAQVEPPRIFSDRPLKGFKRRLDGACGDERLGQTAQVRCRIARRGRHLAPCGDRLFDAAYGKQEFAYVLSILWLVGPALDRKLIKLQRSAA